MYQLLPSFVLGFHGCDRAVGEAVLAGDHLRSSENDWDWLGAGVYFWENSPHRALSYAQMLRQLTKQTKGTINDPFVIGAIIDPGLCLNLSDEGALFELRGAYEILAASVEDPMMLPRNVAGYSSDIDAIKRHLDCAVFETLHAWRENEALSSYHTVRSPFQEGSSLYPGSGFNEKSHVQICVRDPSHIKGYFRPLDANGKTFQHHNPSR